MVKVNIIGQMGTFIKEIFAKIWEKVKAKWSGMMVAPIQANGNEDYHTEKVLLNLYKLGIFKVKGEKPRIGYFEDNVLVS